MIPCGQSLSELLIQLIEDVRKVHSGKKAHSQKDFETVLRLNSASFEKAIQINALEPYQQMAQTMLEKLQNAQKSMEKDLFSCYQQMQKPKSSGRSEPCLSWRLFDSIFQIEVPFSEVYNVLAVIRQEAEKVGKNCALFQQMRKCIVRHIELEILPNPILDGERTALNQGIAIIPTRIYSNPGFYLFDFVTFYDEKLKRYSPLKFRLADYSGSATLEEALGKEQVKHRLGTIAVARNTEIYPLWETAIPIVREKYEKEWDKRD